MTQIDEKAFEKAFSYCTGFTVKSLRAFTEAYEAARAPRTITREEFERAGLAHMDELKNPDCTSASLVNAALATLGITVEEV